MKLNSRYYKILFSLSKMEYLNRWVVFMIDLLLSVFSTYSICLVVSYCLGWGFVFLHIYHLIAFAVLASVVSMFVFNSYANTIRHTTVGDLWRLLMMCVSKEIILALCLIYSDIMVEYRAIIFVGADFFFTFAFLLSSRILMLNSYNILLRSVHGNKKNILIYGIGSDSVALAQGNSTIYMRDYIVRGFFISQTEKKSMRISGYPIYCATNEEELNSLIVSRSIGGILFPSTQTMQTEKEGIVPLCEKLKIKVLVVPNMEEVRGGIIHRSIRKINIEDLLGREEIQINLDKIGELLQDKVVLVTGAAGSIGSEICRQLARFQTRNLICLDSAETPMHDLRLELETKYPTLHFVPVIGDVRSAERMEYVFRAYAPQVVFHAAAYKHVPLMEENPCEAVRVNVFGTRNVADISVKYGVERFVMISTDKAVNPTNIMGCSKRLAEIYVQSLSLALKRGEVKGVTRFITTRFGNVLGSNGSVIPHFKEQIRTGGPVTVTHPDIIRYFMTIPEACRLVLEAGTMGDGGEIFVFDMGEPVKILTLAQRMIELAGLRPDKDIPIQFTGLRPGEKLYEELLSDKEGTKETPHHKIRVASVREYDYSSVLPHIDLLSRLSADVNIPAMVTEMKAFVPEFKSKNSVFEKYDK